MVALLCGIESSQQKMGCPIFEHVLGSPREQNCLCLLGGRYASLSDSSQFCEPTYEEEASQHFPFTVLRRDVI